MSGFIVDGTSKNGVPVRLMVTGLDNDASRALTIRAECLRCSVILSEREYFVVDTEHDVVADARRDALATLAHSCGERN